MTVGIRSGSLLNVSNKCDCLSHPGLYCHKGFKICRIVMFLSHGARLIMWYLFGSVLLEFNVLITSLVANRLSYFVKFFSCTIISLVSCELLSWTQYHRVWRNRIMYDFVPFKVTNLKVIFIWNWNWQWNDERNLCFFFNFYFDKVETTLHIAGRQDGIKVWGKCNLVWGLRVFPSNVVY